jgi:hypothetical protein
MGTEVEFVGFAEGCRVRGKVDLEDSRLADLLNRRDSIVINDATVTSTGDGRRRRFRHLEIGRGELDIIVASGPRGDPRRRRATRSDCVAVRLGTYSAEGFLHAPSTASSVDELPPMLALTDAVLEYSYRDRHVSEWFRTLLINRETAATLRSLTVTQPSIA